MTKLSKQDKINIYNSWKNYGKSVEQLGKEYHVTPSNLRYLLRLMERNGVSILDKSRTNYSIGFKEKAIKRVLINHEVAYQVSLELVLPNQGIIHNWIRKYKEDGYNVINHKKGRLPMKDKDKQIQELQKQIKDLKQKNLKLTVENEFIKKLDALVSQRIKNQKRKK